MKLGIRREEVSPGNAIYHLMPVNAFGFNVEEKFLTGMGFKVVDLPEQDVTRLWEGFSRHINEQIEVEQLYRKPGPTPESTGGMSFGDSPLS